MKTSLIFVLLGAGAVHAQQTRPPIEPASGGEARARERRDLAQRALTEDRHARTHFDTDAAGATWVRGRGYKARFDASGATVFPFLGSDAPALYPVRLALAEAKVGGVSIELVSPARASRADSVVTIDRGVIDERYEAGVEHIEQTFVIESLPSQGDLHLRVRVQTELAAVAHANEFVFANERGGVRYGHASVLGARGEKIAVGTKLVDGAIEIDVPAALVEAAGLPLVVDPIISVFSIDQYQDQFAPDVAYDATNDVYLVVEEEKFASVDDDVYTIRLSSSGAHAGAAYADVTTADWQSPRVANLNAYDQFLVVASIQEPGVAFGQRYIGGRTTSAAGNPSYGATIPISDTTSTFGSMVAPDVGGDPYANTPAYYCVVWQWNTAIVPQTNEIAYRMVGGTGATVGSTHGLASGGHDRIPAISNGNGGQTWTVAWAHDITGPVDVDVHAARINWDGALTSAAFPVHTQYDYVDHPTVSSPFGTGECVVAYQCQPFTIAIVGNVLTGASVGPAQSLASEFSWDYYSPSIDCDGQYLALVNDAIGDPWNPADPRHSLLSSFRLAGGSLISVERQWTEVGANDARRASICSARSTAGPTAHFLAVHDRKPSSGGRSVWGALYDTWLGGPIFSVCAGDGSGTPCPCSNSGSGGHGCANSADAAGGLLGATGAALVSADSLDLTASSIPNGGCMLIQGTNGSLSGLVFGDGKLCLSGTLLRLGVNIAAGGTTSFPGAGSSAIHVAGSVPAGGGERWYQVWYRDSATYCTSDVFNLTNALTVTWLP